MFFSFRNISKNRQQLMGIAGLFIMFCHNSIYLPHWFYNINFNYLRFLFQIGVDMFLLFSGLGCYFSLSKSESVTRFYQKRLLRLFPSYLIFYTIITVAYIFIDKQSFLQKAYSFSPFSFIISGDLTLWFIPAICVLYIISPLIFKIIKWINNEIYTLILILIIYIVAILLQVFSVPYSNILFLRVPSFLFGMLIGYCEKESKTVDLKPFQSVLLFGVFIVSLFLYFFFTDNKIISSRIIFFPLCVTLTTIIASLIPKINLKPFRFLGSITLETYLVHVPLLKITDHLSYKYIHNDLVATWFSNISAVFIAIVAAFALNKSVKMLFFRGENRA